MPESSCNVSFTLTTCYPTIHCNKKLPQLRFLLCNKFTPSKSLLSPKKVIDPKKSVTLKINMVIKSSWWLNHPSKKYHIVKLDHFPKFRDENKTYLKQPPRNRSPPPFRRPAPQRSWQSPYLRRKKHHLYG